MDAPSSLIHSFKASLTAVKGEFVEDLPQFLKSIEKGNILVESQRKVPEDILEHLQTSRFEVLYADELFDSGSYKNIVFDNTVLGITFPVLAIAETGTIIETSRVNKIRSLSLLPPVHLSIIDKTNVVETMSDAIEFFQNQFRNADGELNLPSVLTFITGPSRTADIEQTLTVGVHGPIRKAVFIQ